jgi:TonB family protein
MKVLRSRVVLATISSLVLACLSLGQGESKEVKVLFERAKQLSDIRAKGSPAFVLKGLFTISRGSDHVIMGSYTESWATPSLRRVEVSAEGFHSITVTNDKKGWEQSDGTKTQDISSAASQFAYRTDLVSIDSHEPVKIVDRNNGHWKLRCAGTEEDQFGWRREFCFDKSGGQLVAWSLPFFVSGGESANRCAFTDFQKLGDKTFPKSIRCMEGDTRVIETRVTQLALQEFDSSTFQPPAGAKEFTNCPVQTKAPEVINSPEPVSVKGGPVVLSLVVNTHGKPDEIKVDISGGAEMDNAAVDAVRQWRFKPASCDGQPMEVRISVALTGRAANH